MCQYTPAHFLKCGHPYGPTTHKPWLLEVCRPKIVAAARTPEGQDRRIRNCSPPPPIVENRKCIMCTQREERAEWADITRQIRREDAQHDFGRHLATVRRQDETVAWYDANDPRRASDPSQNWRSVRDPDLARYMINASQIQYDRNPPEPQVIPRYEPREYHGNLATVPEDGSLRFSRGSRGSGGSGGSDDSRRRWRREGF